MWIKQTCDFDILIQLFQTQNYKKGSESGSSFNLSMDRKTSEQVWQIAKSEVYGKGHNIVHCITCKQICVKTGKNNHIVCWTCQTQFCFLCFTHLRKGIKKTHYGPGTVCQQHTPDSKPGGLAKAKKTWPVIAGDVRDAKDINKYTNPAYEQSTFCKQKLLAPPMISMSRHGRRLLTLHKSYGRDHEICKPKRPSCRGA